MPSSAHPRDRFVTVYGRKPVLEALRDPGVQIHQVVMARTVRGDIIAEIERAAEQRGLEIHRGSREDVSRISRNRKQDQGVAADVVAPAMDDLGAALDADSIDTPLLALDGVTTPANVGMILRSATAAGVGVVLPRRGCPEVGPLVVKASAGVAFMARILRCPTLDEGLARLQDAGFRLLGLDAGGQESLWDARFRPRDVLVLGSETGGLAPTTVSRLQGRLHIPMAPGVESLNVAAAATLAAFAMTRQAS